MSPRTHPRDGPDRRLRPRPLDLYVGERDILRPAVDRLAKRAEQDGADLCVHETATMFHVRMTRAIPEGRRTRSELVRLLDERAGPH